MKTMGEYTRQDPVKRSETLTKFADRLSSKKEIVEELQAWNRMFSKDLMQFRARILEPELIVAFH